VKTDVILSSANFLQQITQELV